MHVNKGILDLPPTGRGVGGISRYQLCRARWPLPSPRAGVLPPRPAPTVSWWAKQPRRPTLRSTLLSCSALLATGSVVSLLRRVVASVEGARMRAARPTRKRGLRWRPEPPSAARIEDVGRAGKGAPVHGWSRWAGLAGVEQKLQEERALEVWMGRPAPPTRPPLGIPLALVKGYRCRLEGGG
jgi:hypothetical protein